MTTAWAPLEHRLGNRPVHVHHPMRLADQNEAAIVGNDSTRLHLFTMSTMAAPRPRLLTGDRPTGPLHLGHLVGSLQARVRLQDSHECFFLVADLHALTTRPQPEHIATLPTTVRDIVMDWLAAGIDPECATIYLQSAVPSVAELMVLLSMLMPRMRIDQLTSVKRMAAAAGLPEGGMTMGLWAYPVLQAADILMARATVVPVGQDNVEHIDIAREIAAVFNELYGDVFLLPHAEVSHTPELPGVALGLGGAHNKMSKSLGNAIGLHDTPDEVARKLGTLQEHDASALAVFADAFVPNDGAAMRAALLNGTLTVADARAQVLEGIETTLAPIRARRAELSHEPGHIDEVILDGTIRARAVANDTLERVRDAMGLEPLWQSFVDTARVRAQQRRRVQ